MLGRASTVAATARVGYINWHIYAYSHLSQNAGEEHVMTRLRVAALDLGFSESPKQSSNSTHATAHLLPQSHGHLV
jgi:hypothetical protein